MSVSLCTIICLSVTTSLDNKGKICSLTPPLHIFWEEEGAQFLSLIKNGPNLGSFSLQRKRQGKVQGRRDKGRFISPPFETCLSFC